MFNSFSIPRYVTGWKKYFLGGESYIVPFKGYRISVRPRSNDLFAIGEVIAKEEYTPSIRGADIGFDIILDLGAHIGCFTLWAARKFRPKKILAVEIEQSSYDILIKNLKLNNLTKVVTPVKAAIYSKEGKVWVKPSPVFKSSVDLLSEVDTGKKVRAISLKGLLDLYNIKSVDYFKMDIEGSEKFVLTKENMEIFKKRVKYVFMESHSFLGFEPTFPFKYFRQLGFKIKAKRQIKRPLAPFLIEALNSALI